MRSGEESKSELSYYSGLQLAAWSGKFVSQLSALIQLKSDDPPEKLKDHLNQLLKAYQKMSQLAYPDQIVEEKGQLYMKYQNGMEGVFDAVLLYQALRAMKIVVDTWDQTSNENIVLSCQKKLKEQGLTLPLPALEDKSDEIIELDKNLSELVGQEASLSSDSAGGLLRKGATALKLIQALPKIINALGPMQRRVRQLCDQTLLLNNEFQLWYALPSDPWDRETFATRREIYQGLRALIVTDQNTLEFQPQLNDFIMQGVGKLLDLSKGTVTATSDIVFDQVIGCFSLSGPFIENIFSLIKLTHKKLLTPEMEQTIKESISFALGEAIAPILLKHIAHEVLEQKASSASKQLQIAIKAELENSETQKMLCDTLMKHIRNFSFTADEARKIVQVEQSSAGEEAELSYWAGWILAAKEVLSLMLEVRQLLREEEQPMPLIVTSPATYSAMLSAGIKSLKEGAAEAKSAVVTTIMEKIGASAKLDQKQAKVINALADWFKVAVSNSPDSRVPQIAEVKSSVVEVVELLPPPVVVKPEEIADPVVENLPLEKKEEPRVAEKQLSPKEIAPTIAQQIPLSAEDRLKEYQLDVFEIMYGERPETIEDRRIRFKLKWKNGSTRSIAMKEYSDFVINTLPEICSGLDKELGLYKKHLRTSDNYNKYRGGLRYFSKPYWLSASQDKQDEVTRLQAILNNQDMSLTKRILTLRKEFQEPNSNSAKILSKNRDKWGLSIAKGIAILCTGILPYLGYLLVTGLPKTEGEKQVNNIKSKIRGPYQK